MYGEKAQVSAGYGAPSEAVRQVETYSALNRAEGNFEYLESRLGILNSRIQPLLNSGGSEANKALNPGYSSEFAARIGGFADRIGSVSAVIDDVLSRLEI